MSRARLLTFHEGCVSTAAVAEIPHVEPLKAVVPQLPGVAQALQNGVHEALQEITHSVRHSPVWHVHSPSTRGPLAHLPQK